MLISQNFIFIIGVIMANRINWRAFGPGILIASAAIGGSHLVASTQAGALYGWQLAIIILLANFFKYPFFALPLTMLMRQATVSSQATPKNLNFIFGRFLSCPSYQA